MIADEREIKLPKWAQEQLQAARVAASLRFPDTNPEPDLKFDVNGFGSQRPRDGTIVYSIQTRYGTAHVKGWKFIGAYLYDADTDAEKARRLLSGRRPDGKFWFNKNDAINAARYEVAHSAAHQLMTLEGMLE
jgi:hypothetical protein